MLNHQEKSWFQAMMMARQIEFRLPTEMHAFTIRNTWKGAIYHQRIREEVAVIMPQNTVVFMHSLAIFCRWLCGGLLCDGPRYCRPIRLVEEEDILNPETDC